MAQSSYSQVDRLRRKVQLYQSLSEMEGPAK